MISSRSGCGFLLGLVIACSLHAHAASMSGGSTPRKVCRDVARCTKKLDKGKPCPILPVPKSSLVPPLAPGTFELTPLRNGVWAYYDGGYFALILKLGERLAVLDVPESVTRLINATEQILDGTVPKRIDIVYSHAHFDHIGGATRFYNYVTEKYSSALIFIWGTEESRDLINDSVSKRAVIPNVIVGRAGRTLSLGPGLDVQMEIFGGHTASDLVLYIPRYKREASIAMYVDIVWPGFSPPFNLGTAIDVGRYISAQKEFLKMDFDVFISGHLRLGSRKDVANNLKFSLDLVNAAKTAMASVDNDALSAGGFGKFMDPSETEFGNVWYAFIGVQRRLVVDACYRIMLEKWGCRLAGLDFSLRGHCTTAVSYLIIDY